MINTEALKKRMREMGISQSELAGAVGVAASTMCQKLNNIRPVTLKEAEQISKKLSIADRDFGVYFFH